MGANSVSASVGLDLDIEWVRPPLYRKQREAIFAPQRYSVIEASTKSGKTLGCIIWIVEQAWGLKEGQEAWWVAPIYAQAKIAYRRIKRFLTRIATDDSGNLIEVFVANDGELSITLVNGAIIRFKGADNPDSLYGEDVYAMVIDEASRCKEDAWYACRSTLTATRGKCRIIGNVKGRKNWAYRLARRAEQETKDVADGKLASSNYLYTKLTAYDAVEGGVLELDEIEDAKKLLPIDVFNELYLAIASDDGGNPFGLAAIQKCIKPLSDQSVASWGWDLAKSSDWTVGIGLDARGEACRFERWQGPWTETITRIAALTEAPALVDSTGVGDPILEQLQQLKPNIFEGFHFSQQSKQKLMEGLAVDIQQQTVAYPVGTIVDELEVFEYEYTRTGVKYTAPEGFHDDCVCSLALARLRQRSLALAMSAGGFTGMTRT